MEREILSTNRKGLRINLNSLIYGSFAEIGAGQEVARHFFQAGGASGTVAKTISAYDKAFSDKLYNKNREGRYVSDGRLQKMLNTEFGDLTALLKDIRTPDTTFFSFANTVETLNFSKSNDAHGWMGVKFQYRAGTEPNEVILHVNLKENDALLQQLALGCIPERVMGLCLLQGLHAVPVRPRIPAMTFKSFPGPPGEGAITLWFFVVGVHVQTQFPPGDQLIHERFGGRGKPPPALAATTTRLVHPIR